MYARVVRFTGVTPERIAQMDERIDEQDGPPEGISMSGLQVMVDEEQGSAVVVQLFETAEDMSAAEEAFDSMDSSDTPGTRQSVDRCEIKFELKA